MTTRHTIATQLARTRSRFAGWQFAQLALFFPLFLLVLPYLEHTLLLKGVVTIFLLNTLLVADVARPGGRLVRALGWLLLTVSTIGVLIEEFDVDPSTATYGRLIGIAAHTLLIATCTASILTVLFRSGRVTLDGIFASIVAYQLIGLCFAQIYTVLTMANATMLKLPEGIPASTQAVQLEMIYFSFVTLATLGYGDIVPADSLARTITIIEAMTGQFYVAIVVAVLVSSFVAQRLADLEAGRDR